MFAVLGELHHREHQTRPQNVFSVGLHPSANIWDHKTGSKSESDNNAVMIINNPMRKPYFDHRGSSQTGGRHLASNSFVCLQFNVIFHRVKIVCKTMFGCIEVQLLLQLKLASRTEA